MGGFQSWISRPTKAEELFDAQVQKLCSLRIPQSVCIPLSHDHFQALVLPLKKTVKDIDCSKRSRGRIPFLIVLPNSFIPVKKQLIHIDLNGADLLVDSKNQIFRSLLNGQIPKYCPYVALDIDIGVLSEKSSIKKGKKSVEKNKRSLLTLEEATALLIHFPSVLSEGKTIICGGHCLGNETPGFKRSGNKLILGGFSETEASADLNIASLASRAR